MIGKIHADRLASNLRHLPLLSCLLLIACQDDGHGAHDLAGPQPPSDWAAVAGKVSRVPGDPRTPRMLPVHPMTEDVEVLYGDPDVAGQPFVIRIRELPGAIAPPHSHSVDENITVVSGTWEFGIGEDYDPAKLKTLPTGSYAFAPHGATMFGYSPGPQPAIVQVHGIGPFDIHWKHAASSLDDPGGTAFRFRRGEVVVSPRGKGVIREGYASGAIVQYEIERADGTRFMADESDLRRR